MADKAIGDIIWADRYLIDIAHLDAGAEMDVHGKDAAYVATVRAYAPLHLVVCEDCGATKMARAFVPHHDSLLCEACYERAGIENAHSDGYHDERPAADCADCAPA